VEARVQIDELDLAWEDEADKGRHRRSAARQRAKAARTGRPVKKKGRSGKSAVAFLVIVVLLGAVVAGGYFGISKLQGLFSAPDYKTGGTGTVQVEILADQTASDIAQTLYKADVVKSAKAFVNAAKGDARSKRIQPGFYEMRHKMRAVDALGLLLDPAAKLVTKVTLPEGLTYQDTFSRLSQATKIPVADFEAAAKDPAALGIPDFWFTRKDGHEVKKSIEGFLYPATYEFNPGVDAETILKTIVAKFNEEMQTTGFIDAVQSKLHISPFEALIAASIAQVEGAFPQDMAGISRVLYNRAYSGKFPCGCLQLDSTVNYWLRISGKSAKPSQDLLNSELHNPNDPYNTHDKPGLPIGPISNPGNDALTGAMNPPTDLPAKNYLFFLAIDKAGHTAFATTNDEFEKLKVTARKNGAL
jgi:UPF0755 protein